MLIECVCNCCHLQITKLRSSSRYIFLFLFQKYICLPNIYRQSGAATVGMESSNSRAILDMAIILDGIPMAPILGSNHFLFCVYNKAPFHQIAFHNIYILNVCKLVSSHTFGDPQGNGDHFNSVHVGYHVGYLLFLTNTYNIIHDHQMS